MRILAAILLLSWLAIAVAVPPPGGSGNRGGRFSNYTGDPSPPAGTPAFVDWTNGVPASSATFIKMTNNVTSGNSIVMSVGWEDLDQTWTISDSAGNTYTTLGKTNSGGGVTFIYAEAFRAVNVTGGSPLIITATNNSVIASSAIKCMMIEGSGITSFDVAGSTSTNVSGVGTEQLSGTYNTANNVELLYSLAHNYSARTCIQSNIGWSVGYNIGGANMQYFVTAASGTYQGKQTNSGGAHSIMFSGAFK